MKSLLRVSILCAASAVAALSQSGSPLTPPPQANGYNLVFSEDFSSFDLSPDGYGMHRWYPGIYFHPAKLLPGSITVSNSILDLRWSRYNGRTNTSIEGCAYEASHCNTYRYGYFEAKMKWDVASGAWPAFWMITEQGVWGEPHVGELDIFEGNGNDPTHFYGTINEWNGPNDLVTTNSPSSNRFPLPAGKDLSGWHTYGVLWVKGKVTWFFDDVEMGTAVTPAIFDQQDFFLVLGSQEGNSWQMGNLTGVSSEALNLNVEWVHIYQTPTSPALSVQQQTANLFAHPPALTLLTTVLANPNSALPYAAEPRAAGGTGPYKYTIKSGALPGGLELSPATGMISSVPGETIVGGPYWFTLEVTDALNSTATRTYAGNVAGGRLMHSFTSFPLPTSAGANGITTGPEGDLWFTTTGQAGGNLIGQISTAGVITMMDLTNPSTPTGPPNVPLGGDNAPKSAGRSLIAQRDVSAIATIDPAVLSQRIYRPPTASAATAQITVAQDGTIWFTEAAGSQIAHITNGGSVLETRTPSPNSYPLGIAAGPNNLIVFTEAAANKIGFVSEDGTISGEIPIPTANSLPVSIVFGPDNAFWFTEYGANQIGRIDFSANFKEFPVSSAPTAITVGPDGALYFTETGGNRIGRITIAGTVTEFDVPDIDSGPNGIVAGPDGDLWFIENSVSRFGRLKFDGLQRRNTYSPR
jgi:virginiamycin B lyase